MRRAALTLVLACSAAAAGCANVLMPTPVGFDRQGADPFARTVPARRTPEVRLFVASNRKPTGSSEPGSHFGTERSQHLRLGTMTVTVDGGRIAWPDLEGLSRQSDRPSDPRLQLAAFDDFGAVWTGAAALDPDHGAGASVSDRFADEVRRSLDASANREVFVFVHGFNTTVEGNAAVAASLFHYLGRGGAFVQFEWPSKGSVWSYQADKFAAAASVRAFRHLLTGLAERAGADRVHVIAHSAGAPIAVSAIYELRLMRSREPAAAVRGSLRLGRLVLVAPDMDVGEFRDCVADGAMDLPERTTLYVSSRDKALDFSAWMADFARLGQPLDVLGPKQVEFLENEANVDIVDVGGAERRMGSWLGHSYFHEDPWVSTDVLLTLATGAQPLDRGLQRDGARRYYGFGPEYPARARAAALAALPAPAGAGGGGTPPRTEAR